MKHIARREFLRGTSAITITALSRIAVGQTYVNPSQFPGSTFMEQCNNMAAQAPMASYAYLPPALYQRTPGTDYGILDTGRIAGWISTANERNPLNVDSSFAGVATPFVSRPAPPVFAALSRRFENLIWSPIDGDPTYNKNDPRCNYVKRYMSFEYANGHGEGKMVWRGCYLPPGVDASAVFEANDGNAGVFSSSFYDCRTSGGMRFTGLGNPNGGAGDSVRFYNHRADGKFGIDFSGMAGAGEVYIDGLQGATLAGPMLKIRRGNKFVVTGLNVEQQNWDSALFPGPKRVIDISMENAWIPVPGQLPSMLNGLELAGTVSAHASVPFDHVVYIAGAFMPRIDRRLNLYSPSALTTTALEFAASCMYPIIGSPTFGASSKFTNKIVCPKETRPYGVVVTPAWWNGFFDIPFNSQNSNVAILKDLSGNVTLAGEIRSSGTVTNGSVAFGLPAGFRSRKEIAIPIFSDTGYQHWLVCAPQTDDATGAPVSIEAGIGQSLTGATRWRIGATYQEYYHHLGIVTDN